jgi:predicted nucleic acid-binding protein
VVGEIVYVLSSPSWYGLSDRDIAARLVPILSLRGLRLANKGTYMRALEIYATSSVDFEDAVSVAHMGRLGISEIVSYDRDFDELPGISRIEP